VLWQRYQSSWYSHSFSQITFRNNSKTLPVLSFMIIIHCSSSCDELQEWSRQTVSEIGICSSSINKIDKYLDVCGCDRVTGAVRVSKGVQESVETPLKQFYKWLLQQILPWAAQHTVFQYVWYPCGVFPAISNISRKWIPAFHLLASYTNQQEL